MLKKKQKIWHQNEALYGQQIASHICIYPPTPRRKNLSGFLGSHDPRRNCLLPRTIRKNLLRKYCQIKIYHKYGFWAGQIFLKLKRQFGVRKARESQLGESLCCDHPSPATGRRRRGVHNAHIERERGKMSHFCWCPRVSIVNVQEVIHIPESAKNCQYHCCLKNDRRNSGCTLRQKKTWLNLIWASISLSQHQPASICIQFSKRKYI